MTELCVYSVQDRFSLGSIICQPPNQDANSCLRLGGIIPGDKVLKVRAGTNAVPEPVAGSWRHLFVEISNSFPCRCVVVQTLTSRAPTRVVICPSLVVRRVDVPGRNARICAPTLALYMPEYCRVSLLETGTTTSGHNRPCLFGNRQHRHHCLE